MSLHKVLRPVDLWAIAVGLVISGEYFGWSYGWSVAGTIGFLITTVVIAVMYTALVFSLTELTCAIPHADGPFAYVKRAFGQRLGLVAGFATLIEFLFAPPAIAFALGSYLHFIVPSLPITLGALIVLCAFMLLNLLGVKQTVKFELVVTVIAVVELAIFIALVLPHFAWDNFLAHNESYDWHGALAAIPYAIWFFLAIEGVAMAAEEVKDPNRDIPKGYLSGIATLLVLSLGVMFAAGGAGDWRTLSTMDYPVPEAMAMALGKSHWSVKLFAGIGLFGLVASLNGIVYSSSRQVFALARAGVLPRWLAHVDNRFRAPNRAVLASCGIGFIAILTGHTSQLITLSALGAVLVYVLCMAALFTLRKKEPYLPRPYQVPGFPFVPALALMLSVMALVALVYFNQALALWLAAIIVVGLVVQKLPSAFSRHEIS